MMDLCDVYFGKKVAQQGAAVSVRINGHTDVFFQVIDEQQFYTFLYSLGRNATDEQVRYAFFAQVALANGGREYCGLRSLHKPLNFGLLVPPTPQQLRARL